MSWKQPVDVDIYRFFGDNHLQRDLFLHLLLHAQHEDMKQPDFYNKQSFLLKRGQVIFGRKRYGQLLRCAESTAERSLRALEVAGKVARQPNAHYTVVTILNYDQLTTIEQRSGSKRTGDGQQKNTPKSESPGVKDISSNEEIQKHSFSEKITQMLEAYLASCTGKRKKNEAAITMLTNKLTKALKNGWSEEAICKDIELSIESMRNSFLYDLDDPKRQGRVGDVAYGCMQGLSTERMSKLRTRISTFRTNLGRDPTDGEVRNMLEKIT